VTGIVMSLRGNIDSNGFFNVNDCLFYGDAVSMSLSPHIQLENENTREPLYIMFASGFEIGSTSTEPLVLASQMLIDFICGRLGGDSEIKTACNIAKVIFAGNLISTAEVGKGTGRDKHSNAKAQAEAIAPSKLFDSLLAQILGSCKVDIMPGLVIYYIILLYIIYLLLLLY
jgi:DNA polymerase delta subunit 2